MDPEFWSPGSCRCRNFPARQIDFAREVPLAQLLGNGIVQNAFIERVCTFIHDRAGNRRCRSLDGCLHQFDDSSLNRCCDVLTGFAECLGHHAWPFGWMRVFTLCLMNAIAFSGSDFILNDRHGVSDTVDHFHHATLHKPSLKAPTRQPFDQPQISVLMETLQIVGRHFDRVANDG